MVYQRYLPLCILTKVICDRKKIVQNVSSARDDFIRDEQYDCWLLNPAWKIMPSIAIFDEGPVVLTCRDHDGGNSKFMIHTCRQPNHILPSKHSDQLAHAVIQSRTIKPVKSTQYSTQFQMHEQRGTFNGIDTFGLSDFRQFDFSSKLLAESEARAIKNRPDVSSLLSQLVKEKVFGKSVAASRREEAEYMTSGIDYSVYSRGATYVPFDAAMMLMKDINAKEVFVTVDDHINDNQEQQVHTRSFKKIWPSFMYPCQIMNGYGARFPCVPTFKSRRNSGVEHDDAMFCWTISALLTRLESLWNITANCELYTSKWHGWMLVKLTKECFKGVLQKKQDSRDPFKYVKVSSITKTIDRLSYIGNDLEELFSDCSSVLYLNFNHREDYNYFNQIDSDVHSVVIVDNADIFNLGNFEFIIDIGRENIKYELCFISSTWHTGNDWNGYVYSKHAGANFKSWWYQERHDSITRHLLNPPSLDNFVGESSLVLGYVCNQNKETQDAKNEFLAYIGGKKNLLCHLHHTPLICSTDRKLKCKCGKNEYYRCCTLGCSCCICKLCADQVDPTIITYVKDQSSEVDLRSAQDDDESACSDTTSIGDTELITPFDEENENIAFESNDDSNNLLSVDDFEEFVTRAEDPAIDVGDDDDDFEFGITLPTTDAGEVPVTIREEQSIQEGSTYVSGHVVLNQCGTLLTRSKHQIKGSSKHKFFLQKIHSTSPGNCSPLLYPEYMIFISCFYMSAGSDQAGLGAIPAPLLTQSIGTYGFSSIPQHGRCRLTSPSCKCCYSCL
jgi:hypothetical protein